MGKNVLSVNWKAFEGAAYKKKMLRLRPNADGVFVCPITNCLHFGFNSQRGLRKHIDNRHPWFYYFEEEPKIKREEVAKDERVHLKQPTHNIPSFSLSDGVGKGFLQWLCTPLGGGKVLKEATQIGKRAMKFLMTVLGDSEAGSNATEEYIDCCLGSPSLVIKFMQTVTSEWGISSSAALNYLKSMSDLMDFRKANGVSDVVLRSFAVTEVYVRRGKDNLRKKKAMEYGRNLDLETLIARDSWATIEEMELVIPFHAPRFKIIAEKCGTIPPTPTVTDLAFTTRFIATFLFLRVKCSRPMTFQHITLQMVEKAKVNGGFIDQTEFKTARKYIFDTLIISQEVITVLDCYICKVRPLLHPTCPYLLVSTNGKQYNSFTTAMTLLVKEAIGKYINPTRYRQIIETESAQRLTSEEQQVVSQDQKHSSKVAERCYRKQLSREVATQSKKCMEKMLGDTRNRSSEQLADIFSAITTNNMEFEQAVIEKTGSILGIANSDIDIVNLTHDTSECQEEILEHDKVQGEKTENSTITDVVITGSRVGCATFSTGTLLPDICTPEALGVWSAVGIDVAVKKEVAERIVRSTSRTNNRFTGEEDQCLKKGIEKYGKGNWRKMLHDPQLLFHESRTRDSLRMRAESCAFRILMKLNI